MQIRTRLTAQFITVVTLLIAVIFSIIYISAASYRESEFYQRLRNKAQTSAEMFVSVDQIDSTMLRLFDRRQKDKLPMENVSIYDSEDREIYTNNDSIEFYITPHILDEVRHAREVILNQEPLEILGITYEDRQHKFVVFAGANDIYGKSKIRNLRKTLLILLICSITGIAIAGWIYSGRALKPLARVIKDVKNLDPTHLAGRLSIGRHNDEIGRLIATFNMLLDRIEKTFNLQKLFITGASHELKNPLTSITSQLQVSLIRERSQEEYRALVMSVLEDIQALNKTTHDLMELARLTNERYVVREPVRIDEVVWKATESLLKTHKEYNINVQMQLPHDQDLLIVSGHPALLQVALTNLMDNACKFSPDNSCTIELELWQEQVLIRIIDQGPGIPEEIQPFIYMPFFRGDSTAQEKGHGVGLSFTKTILELHDAQLDLLTNNSGTTFTIILK